MRSFFVAGRILFGGFFAFSGLHHFIERRKLSGYAASKGTPAAEVAVPATGALLLMGGASVLTGIKPREGLAAIVAFLIPVSFQMHRFWEISDPAQQQAEMTNFMKNMALAGAALMMMQLHEPWPASVTEIADGEDMYIRLGNRDLRSLPA
jgi:uncharacterized membrane protein YphA (DoxX/SURF4 family)